MASSICGLLPNQPYADLIILRFPASGPVGNTPNFRSLKNDPAPKAGHPVLNQDASPHANWLARLPRFPEIFQEDEDSLEDNCCQSPTPVTRPREATLCFVRLAAPRAGTPLLTGTNRSNHQS